jgi:uncharacterized membrane protein YfhO
MQFGIVVNKTFTKANKFLKSLLSKIFPGDSKLYLIPGMFVILILSITYSINNLYPFGPNSIAWCDMKQQTIPMMLLFKDVLSGEQSIFFHMGNAGGTNFWGIFFFFVSSPFSLLMVFIEKIDIVVMMNVFVAFKMALAGILSMIMFRKVFTGIKVYPAVILSTLYAFCGFALMFSQNLIWLDMLYLLPLMVLGLYRIIYMGKYLTFLMVFSCMLVVNYYMSFMIAIFIALSSSLILFFRKHSTSRNFENDYKLEKSIGLISFSTIISVLATSFVWLPSFLQYLSSARKISILDTIKSGSINAPYETTLSTVFATSLILTIIPLILLNAKKIIPPLKLNILFTLLLIPLVIEPINKMWHTGSYQAFPARYSYITIIIGLLIIGYYFSKSNYFDMTDPEDEMKKDNIKDFISENSNEITSENNNNNNTNNNTTNNNTTNNNTTYNNNNKNINNSNKPGLGYLLISVLITISAAFFITYLLIYKRDSIDAYTSTLWADSASFLYLLLAFAILGTVYSVLIIFRHLRLITGSTFMIVFAFLTAIELLFNTGIYLGYTSNSTSGYANIFDMENRIDSYKSAIQSTSSYFDGGVDKLKNEPYRVKTHNKYFDVNLLGGLNMPTLNTYSSLTSTDYLTVMKKLGFSSYWMEVSASQGSRFSDAFMGNRYEIFNNSDFNGRFLSDSVIYRNNEYKIVENKAALDIGMVLSEKALSTIRNIPDNDRFSIQNTLFQAITGSKDNLFIQYSPWSFNNISIDKTTDGLNQITKLSDTGPFILDYNIEISNREILYFDCFDKVSNSLVEHVNDSFNITVNGTNIQSSYPNKQVNGMLELGEFENESVNIRIELLKNVSAQSFGVAGLDFGLMSDELLKFKNTTPISQFSQKGNSLNIKFGDAPTDSTGAEEKYLLLTAPYEGDIKAIIDGSDHVKVERVFGPLIAVKIPGDIKSIKFEFYPDGLLPGFIISILSILLGIFIFRNKSSLMGNKLVVFALISVKYLFGAFSLLLFFAIYIFPLIYRML